MSSVMVFGVSCLLGRKSIITILYLFVSKVQGMFTLARSIAYYERFKVKYRRQLRSWILPENSGYMAGRLLTALPSSCPPPFEHWNMSCCQVSCKVHFVHNILWFESFWYLDCKVFISIFHAEFYITISHYIHLKCTTCCSISSGRNIINDKALPLLNILKLI